jgi:hypothetical protein
LKELSKDRLSEISELTNSAYVNACSELGLSNEKLRILYTIGDISQEEFLKGAEDIRVNYCNHIIKLTTDALNDILMAHNNGQFLRAQDTIDRIATELLMRELNEKK